MTTWPQLTSDSWTASRQTLHRFLQIPGKIALAQTPLLNHWWNDGYQLSAEGFTTVLMGKDDVRLQITFNVFDHKLHINSTSGKSVVIDLVGISVADFYHRVLDAVAELGLPTKIWDQPVEIPDAKPFTEDNEPGAYDPESVRTYWQLLLAIDGVYQDFRAEFMGKQSPALLYFGSMDYTISQFSGRVAPPNPTKAPYCGPQVMVEADCREVYVVGYWPDLGAEGAFFSYFYPAPQGYEKAKLQPDAAYFDADYGEFLLPLEAVRTSGDPAGTLSAFLRSGYLSGAKAGDWDNATLLRNKAEFEKAVEDVLQIWQRESDTGKEK